MEGVLKLACSGVICRCTTPRLMCKSSRLAGTTAARMGRLRERLPHASSPAPLRVCPKCPSVILKHFPPSFITNRVRMASSNSSSESEKESGVGGGEAAESRGEEQGRGGDGVKLDTVVSFVLGIAGIGIILHSASEMMLISDSHLWSRAEGLIVASKIECVSSGFLAHVSSNNRKRCNVEVLYNFTDGLGKSHTALFRAVVPASDADKLVTGKRCEVAFHPHSPSSHNLLVLEDDTGEVREGCGSCAAVRCVLGAALVAYSAYVLFL